MYKIKLNLVRCAKTFISVSYVENYEKSIY